MTEEELISKRDWECTRKKAFKRLEWAEEALERGLKAKHYTENYHIYPCDFCTSYHIGRKPKHVSTEI